MNNSYSCEGKGRYGSMQLRMNLWVCRYNCAIPWEHTPYLSDSEVAFHEEVLHQVACSFTFYWYTLITTVITCSFWLWTHFPQPRKHNLYGLLKLNFLMSDTLPVVNHTYIILHLKKTWFYWVIVYIKCKAMFTASRSDSTQLNWPVELSWVAS